MSLVWLYDGNFWIVLGFDIWLVVKWGWVGCGIWRGFVERLGWNFGWFFGGIEGLIGIGYDIFGVEWIRCLVGIEYFGLICENGIVWCGCMDGCILCLVVCEVGGWEIFWFG